MTDIIPTGVIFTEKEYLFPYWRSFRLKYGPLLKPSPSCCESVQSWVCFPACRSSRCKLLRLLPNEVFSFAPFSPGNRAAASIVTKHTVGLCCHPSQAGQICDDGNIRLFLLFASNICSWCWNSLSWTNRLSFEIYAMCRSSSLYDDLFLII